MDIFDHIPTRGKQLLASGDVGLEGLLTDSSFIMNNMKFVATADSLKMSSIFSEVEQWLEENSEGRWFAYTFRYFFFEMQNDAMLFKLRFG